MTVARLKTVRTVRTMAALNTIDAIAERVTNLLSHGRHLTVVSRLIGRDSTPEVTAGLLPDGPPEVWKRNSSDGFNVTLSPGLRHGFGVAAHRNDQCDTEQQAWTRWHSGDRRDLTEVVMTGGLTGDGPAGDDQLVIRHWNGNGAGREVVVAFDNDTGPAAEKRHAENAPPNVVAQIIAARKRLSAVHGVHHRATTAEVLAEALRVESS